MTETQHQATRQALGQPFTSQAIRAFANLWDSVANPGEALRLTFVNARRLFNNHRRRFWAAARGDPAVRALLDTMNAQFFGKPGSAPWIVLPDGTRMQLTIDHIIERQTDPMRALSSDNLRLSTRLENTVVLRLLHSLDPFINLPANWSNMPEGGIDISDFDLDPLDP